MRERWPRCTLLLTQSSHVISHLLALHAKGDTHTGVDIESDKEGVLHSVKAGVIDLVAVKISALTMAARTALTLISVDQIIMSKAAGGPKPKKQEHWDEDD